MTEENALYRSIAEELINELSIFEHIKDSDVKIAYLSSDEEKKKDRKIILADTYKVNKTRYSFICPYDFFITIYEPNCIGLNDKQLRILIQHELQHIGINNEGNEPSYYVVPHDIEDFKNIIEEYGLEWNRRE